MQSIQQPPTHIYKNVDSPLFRKFLQSECYFEKPLSFVAVDEYYGINEKNRMEFLAEEDPETLKIIEASENITIYDPMWWAQVYRCYSCAPIVAFLHLLDIGDKNTVWVIESGADHWYYSVGHPEKPDTVFYDPQEKVYEANGIESKMRPCDYRIKSFKRITVDMKKTDFDELSE